MNGAISSGNNVTKIRIPEKKIGFCTGCGVCNSTHKCIQNDDMSEILDMMVETDVIVLATPVYFYTRDAQLKTLIDRTVPRYTEISNKEFYFIVTAADTNARMHEKTVDGIRGFSEDCLDNAIEKGIIYATGVWQKNDVSGTKFMKQAFEMGKNV